jgi:hypothetical protein
MIHTKLIVKKRPSLALNVLLHLGMALLGYLLVVLCFCL